MKLSNRGDETVSAIRHFERVLVLTKRLAEQGVAVRGHEFYPHFLGMWTIIAGSFEHRFRFLWDDRDQVLTISEAHFDDHGGPLGDWLNLNEQSIDRRNGADPFKNVEGFFENLSGEKAP